MKNLSNKKILFVICGGVSAYKSLETIRLFRKNNFEIKTILTKAAKEFVTPLSVASLSQGKVYEDLFNLENETEMDHISLSNKLSYTLPPDSETIDNGVTNFLPLLVKIVLISKLFFFNNLIKSNVL